MRIHALTLTPALVLVLILCPARLSASAIDVSILNQTLVTSAFGQVSGEPSCMSSGQFSATCSSSNPGILYGAAANSSSSITQAGTLSASASTLGAQSRANSSATLTDTILITGGSGTGYLNVAFSWGSSIFDGGGSVAANGAGTQTQVHGWQPPMWIVAPFTFGQPFTYDASVFTESDGQYGAEGVVSMSLEGARVYSTQPQCNPSQFTGQTYGLCADAGYTDATAILADPGTSEITSAPEPASLSLMALGLLLLARARVRYSNRPNLQLRNRPCDH